MDWTFLSLFDHLILQLLNFMYCQSNLLLKLNASWYYVCSLRYVDGRNSMEKRHLAGDLIDSMWFSKS